MQCSLLQRSQDALGMGREGKGEEKRVQISTWRKYMLKGREGGDGVKRSSAPPWALVCYTSSMDAGGVWHWPCGLGGSLWGQILEQARQVGVQCSGGEWGHVIHHPRGEAVCGHSWRQVGGFGNRKVRDFSMSPVFRRLPSGIDPESL